MVTRWAGAKYRHIYSWKGVRRPPIKRISPVLIIIHPDTSMVDVMEHFAPLSDQFWGRQRVRSLSGAKYRHICSRKGARRPPFDLISPALINIHPNTSMRDVMEHFAPHSDQFWGRQRVRSPSELEITLFAPGRGPGGLLLTWYLLFCYISALTHQWGMLWCILRHSQINSEVSRGSGARPEPNTSYSPNEELQSDLRWSLRVAPTSGLVWQQPKESRNEARAR